MNIEHYEKNTANKRLKRDCQRLAFPVPMSRGGFGCCD
ncbi:Death on curing protein, Doc toxin [Vibrio cholerae]|nr:Death on curing protein, Doc toxin [Vibrio cholerae]